MEKIYFENNRKVMFEDLKEAINEDGKRVYSDELLREISNGNYNYINETLTPAQREDRNFMEPLLYAVRNDAKNGSYIIYKYYGENLQQDLGLLIDVILEDPKIIEDTPISNNKDFILDVVETNPRVLFYISDNLKNDEDFIEELRELGDEGVDNCIAIALDPSLTSDAEFMKEAIKEDPSLLKVADESLKNDYKFIKEITKENYETVEHIIKNRNDFGLEGIKGAKETTKELTIEDYMAILDEMSEKSDDDRYKRVRNKVNEKGIDDPRVIKWITAMAAQHSDQITPENFKKVFDNAILTMTKIQKDLTEDGKIKILTENTSELITPQILNRLKEAAISKGFEISDEQEALFKEYEEFYKEYRQKLAEKKKEEIKTIKPRDIESLAEDRAQFNKIQEERNAIETKEKELGENENDRTND